jgi:hypothetical protein
MTSLEDKPEPEVTSKPEVTSSQTVTSGRLKHLAENLLKQKRALVKIIQ